MMNWHISPPHLIFADPLGTTPDGNYIYRFLFSEEPEVVWGDKFNITPASAVHGLHPSPETISEEWRVVSPIQLLTAVESDWFSMQDCIDGIIALVFSTDDETSVLLGDNQVLPGDDIVIIEGAAVGAVGIAVVGETDGAEDGPVDGRLKRGAEGRTANDVCSAIRPVVDTVVIVVVEAPVADTPPGRRRRVDAVAVIVRRIAPEVTGLVPSHGVTLAGRHPVHVVQVVHAHVIVVTVVETGIPVHLLGLGIGGYGIG